MPKAAKEPSGKHGGVPYNKAPTSGKSRSRTVTRIDHDHHETQPKTAFNEHEWALPEGRQVFTEQTPVKVKVKVEPTDERQDGHIDEMTNPSLPRKNDHQVQHLNARSLLSDDDAAPQLPVDNETSLFPRDNLAPLVQVLSSNTSNRRLVEAAIEEIIFQPSATHARSAHDAPGLAQVNAFLASITVDSVDRARIEDVLFGALAIILSKWQSDVESSRAGSSTAPTAPLSPGSSSFRPVTLTPNMAIPASGTQDQTAFGANSSGGPHLRVAGFLFGGASEFDRTDGAPAEDMVDSAKNDVNNPGRPNPARFQQSRSTPPEFESAFALFTSYVGAAQEDMRLRQKHRFVSNQALGVFAKSIWKALEKLQRSEWRALHKTWSSQLGDAEVAQALVKSQDLARRMVPESVSESSASSYSSLNLSPATFRAFFPNIIPASTTWEPGQAYYVCRPPRPGKGTLSCLFVVGTPDKQIQDIDAKEVEGACCKVYGPLDPQGFLGVRQENANVWVAIFVQKGDPTFKPWESTFITLHNRSVRAEHHHGSATHVFIADMTTSGVPTDRVPHYVAQAFRGSGKNGPQLLVQHGDDERKGRQFLLRFRNGPQCQRFYISMETASKKHYMATFVPRSLAEACKLCKTYHRHRGCPSAREIDLPVIKQVRVVKAE